MKKVLSVLLSVVLLFGVINILPISVFAQETDIAEVGADDYPYRGSTTSVVDLWNFYSLNCTSFCAWRLNNNNGVDFHNHYGGVQWGNAKNWDDAARQLGIPVNNSPNVGSIACWNRGTYGHVAWVSNVYSDGTIDIEEYNYGGRYQYGTRHLSASDPDDFIHIKDIIDYDDPEIETWYYDGATDHSDFRPVIRVKNPETVSEVNFAVRYENTDWKWYRGEFNGGNAWYCDVLSSDLGTGTTITCHVYVRGKNGSYTGYPFVNLNLGKDADPEAINWYYDGATDYSDFRPVIRIANPEAVSYVKFAVRYNSTDWKWYDGLFNGGNAWYCDVLSSDLGSGQYIVCHVYVYAKNGSYKGYPLENLKLDKDYDDPILNKWEYETITEEKEYRAVMGFENPETVASVRFAIRDNDSDWKWYDGIFDGEKTWYYDIITSDLRLTDSLYCHAYVQGRNGFYKGYPYPEIDISETPTSSTETPTDSPKPITTFLGDADGDGIVEIVDATIIQRHLSNLTVPYSEETLMNADVDGDGELTVLDATFIQRYIAKIETHYPIGEPIT